MPRGLVRPSPETSEAQQSPIPTTPFDRNPHNYRQIIPVSVRAWNNHKSMLAAKLEDTEGKVHILFTISDNVFAFCRVP